MVLQIHPISVERNDQSFTDVDTPKSTHSPKNFVNYCFKAIINTERKQIIYIIFVYNLFNLIYIFI